MMTKKIITLSATALLSALAACSTGETSPSDASAADRTIVADGAPRDLAGDAPQREDATRGDARVYPTDDAGCTQVTGVGCCMGQLLMWCEKGEVKTLDCAKNATSSPPQPWKIRCGWHPDYENYDCGFEEADPSGVNPLWCQGYAPPDGGLPDAAEPPPSECGTIPFQGCCEGTIAKWCSNGKIESVDCNDVGDVCGWRAEDEYYACTGQPTEEPTGTYPRLCP